MTHSHLLPTSTSTDGTAREPRRGDEARIRVELWSAAIWIGAAFFATCTIVMARSANSAYLACQSSDTDACSNPMTAFIVSGAFVLIVAVIAQTAVIRRYRGSRRLKSRVRESAILWLVVGLLALGLAQAEALNNVRTASCNATSGATGNSICFDFGGELRFMIYLVVIFGLLVQGTMLMDGTRRIMRTRR
jgi:hypothetical protein